MLPTFLNLTSFLLGSVWHSASMHRLAYYTDGSAATAAGCHVDGTDDDD